MDFKKYEDDFLNFMQAKLNSNQFYKRNNENEPTKEDMENLNNDLLVAKLREYIQASTEESVMTLEELEKEFDKFRGNYLDVIERFPNMTERDQKLFILYSLFHFGLYFYRENIEGIVTEEVLNEVDERAMEFMNYGSYTGCDLKFSSSIYGINLSGEGYNISMPFNSKSCVKNIDNLSVEDLARMASSGRSAKGEEEEIFQALNKERNNELQAFEALLKTLVNSHRK